IRRSGGSSWVRMRVESVPRSSDPASIPGRQNGLGTVDGADLAVDVVEVGADGRDREVHFAGDLLVDHALGEVAENVQLAAGERAGLADPGGVLGRQRQLVEEIAERFRAEAAALGAD